MSQHVIELNGKRYDAITGAYMGKGTRPGFHYASHGRVIDGFMRPAPKAAPEPTEELLEHHPTPKILQPPRAQAPAARHAHRRKAEAPKQLTAHQPEHAKTLMRRSVHKPHVARKPVIKPQAPVEMIAKPHSALMRKPSALSVDPVRQKRAHHVAKHQAVRHFHAMHQPPATHKTVHVPTIPVKPVPAHAMPQHARQAGNQHAHKDIFEAAIAHATSHQQPHHTPRAHRMRRRLVNTLAIVGAFLVIGGFVGYLNLPNIELRVASMRAGFSAAMPGYTPTGYALQGSVKRTGSTVSLSFHSGESHYTITQQASDWNSQTLLDNTLALNNAHDTVEKNGQTIYIYGDGSGAAWVNGGVRYDLTGNAELSQNDITAIATSL